MSDLEAEIDRACQALRGRLQAVAAPIVAVACVRNEQDIVERFVRHNLTIVDALLILDHDSRDRTPAILQSLVDEGLPLALCHADTPGMHQGEWMGQMARGAATRLAAHPIVPLDADEFLTGSAPDAMRSKLRSTDRNGARALEWLGYVPMPADPPNEIDIIRRVTHRRAREIAHTVKVAVGNQVASEPAFRWLHGMHQAQRGFVPIAVAPQEPDLALAHFPVRTIEQVRAKVATKRLTNAARNGKTSLNYDWLESLVPLGAAMTPDDLRRAALFYLCQREDDDDEVIAAPLPTTSGALRYTSLGTADALDRVMWVALEQAVQWASIPQVSETGIAAGAIFAENRRLRGAMQSIEAALAMHGSDPETVAEAARQRLTQHGSSPPRDHRTLLDRIRAGLTRHIGGSFRSR